MNVYRRGPAGPTEIAMAAAAGLLAGSVVFYLARMWLQREPVAETKPRAAPARGDDLPAGGDDLPTGRRESGEDDLAPNGPASAEANRESGPAPS